MIFNLAILLAISLTFPLSISAKELKVFPPSYRWAKVVAGEKATMPVSVLVRNNSAQPRMYHLRVKTPVDLQIDLENGYAVIPDIAWVSFSEVMVQVPAQSSRSVKVFAQIPAEVKCEAPWIFFVEVKEEVARYGYLQGAPDMFALAAYSKIYLVPEKKNSD